MAALLLPFMRDSHHHEGACKCLGEIVVKRMDVAIKMEHLLSLGIVAHLSEAAASGGVEISTHFSSLAAALALELLDCWCVLPRAQSKLGDSDRPSARTPPSS